MENGHRDPLASCSSLETPYTEPTAAKFLCSGPPSGNDDHRVIIRDANYIPGVVIAENNNSEQ